MSATRSALAARAVPGAAKGGFGARIAGLKSGAAARWESFFAELGARLRKRAPLSRATFVGLFGFAACIPFSISLAQICVFGAITAWLASLYGEPSPPVRKFPLREPWLLFALLTLASALHSSAPLQSLIESRDLTQILIFYLTMNVLEDDREVLWLVKTLLSASGVAASCVLLVWSAAPPDARMAGFFSNPMTLGGFLLAPGLASLSWAFASGRKRAETWVWLASLLIVLALLTTLSRHAWVGLVAGMVVIAVARKSGKAVLLLTAAALAVAFVAPHSIGERAKNILNPREKSAAERLYVWESGFRMWMDEKILGFGPAQVKRHYPRYAHPESSGKPRGHLHNNLAQLAVERGAFALAAWVWFWIGYFRAVTRRLRDSGGGSFASRFRVLSGLAVAAGFLSAGMFEYNFGDSEVAMTVFLALALPFAGGAAGASRSSPAR